MLEWLGYTGELKNRNMRFKKLIYNAKIIPYKTVTIDSTTFISLTPCNLLRAILKMKTDRADYVREFLQNMFFMQGRYVKYCEEKIKIEQNHVTFLREENTSLKRKLTAETYKYQTNQHLVMPSNNGKKRSVFCIIDYGNGNGYAIRRLRESFDETKRKVCKNYPNSEIALELSYCANPIYLYNNIKNYVYANLSDRAEIVGNNISISKGYSFRKFVTDLLKLDDLQRVKDKIMIYGDQLVIKEVLNDLCDRVENIVG
jgi:hypothetical protein